jgi:hypothetical protein
MARDTGFIMLLPVNLRYPPEGGLSGRFATSGPCYIY